MHRILQITPSLVDGGAERFVVDLSNELHHRGHSVQLISLSATEESPLLGDVQAPITSLNKRMGYDLIVFLKLSWNILTSNYDVVHTHTRALNYVSILAIVLSPSKVVHTIHNDAKQEESSQLMRFRKKLLLRLKLVHAVTISKESQTSCLKYFGINSSRIENGTRQITKSQVFEKTQQEIDSYRLDKNTRVFVNIARVSVQKNQEMLLEAMACLENKNVILLIIGRQTEKQYYQSLLSSKPKNVHFLGPRSNATDFLYLADGFVLSSKWEGMPISVIEAFAAGCVPICTPAGGVVNMIGKEFGILSDDFSTDSFVSAMNSFLGLAQDESKAIQESIRKEYARTYSISSCASRYIDLFQTL